MMMQLKPSQMWVNRWEVESTSSNAKYVVAQKADGSWGCSCPRWRFSKTDANGHRPDCKHIHGVRGSEPVATVAQVAEMKRARNIPMTPTVSSAPVFLLQTRRSIRLVD